MIENVMSRLHMDGGCDGESGGAPAPAPPPAAAKPSPPSPRSIKAKYARESRGGGGKPALAAAASPRARARRMSSALDYSALALPGVATNVHRTADDVIQLLSTLLVPGEEEETEERRPTTPSGGGCSPASLAPPRLARPRASVDLGSFCKGRGGGSGARSPRRMRGASEADVLHYERRYGYGAGAGAERHAESPLLVSTEVSATEDEDASDMELVVQSARAQPAASPAAPPAAAPAARDRTSPPFGCCRLS